jgi:hypothetical protein
MIRLILLILLLLLSLLALLKAPSYHLWLMAIAVTEFPLIFAGCTLVALAAGFWANKYQVPATITGMIALLLFLSPIFRSYLVSRHLKNDMATAFGTANIDAAPFSPREFFKLKFTGSVKYQTFTYATYQDGAAVTLDIYPSRIAGKRPCVIVVHGGSWSSGDSKQLPDL